MSYDSWEIAAGTDGDLLRAIRISTDVGIATEQKEQKLASVTSHQVVLPGSANKLQRRSECRSGCLFKCDARIVLPSRDPFHNG